MHLIDRGACSKVKPANGALFIQNNDSQLVMLYSGIQSLIGGLIAWTPNWVFSIWKRWLQFQVV